MSSAARNAASSAGAAGGGQPPWQPSAPLATLRVRAQLLETTRRFFAARGVLEVDTPALVRCALSEPNLHSVPVHLPGLPGLPAPGLPGRPDQAHQPDQAADSGTLFLATSPEYAMKRLLAAGSGDIYQLSHVFRGAEASRLHNAEFMLVEWYRLGFGLQQMMLEAAQLAHELLGVAADAPLEQLAYVQAFQRELGVDPMGLADAALRRLSGAHGLDTALAQRCTRDELLDWLMGVAVGPRLGREHLCLLHHYPASQAALARLDPADRSLALRFELYYRGVELANGFEELADEREQRARFEAEQLERRRRSLPAHPLDERLLAALAHGLPKVSGVALGFDRALMLRVGARDIREVLAFPTDLA
ncbi:MAG: EF-P lysine aminoacylase EpmA [Steroidobacteraceae bacterium]